MDEWTHKEEAATDALVDGDDIPWDNPDFLAELALAETQGRLSISSSISNPNTNANAPPSSFLYHPRQQLPTTAGSASYDAYSPPRQLLQPTQSVRHEADGRSEEWGRVSKQLNELVSECVELRKKENSKRDGQIRPVVTLSQQNKEGTYRNESGSLIAEVHSGDAQHNAAKGFVDHIGERKSSGTPTLASIGVQTDQAGDTDDDWTSSHDLSRKLQDIWGCRTDSNFDKNVVSQLFTACSAEFQVLSACMTVNKSSTMLVGSVNFSHAQGSSCNTSETARVSRLYSVLSQIHDGLSLSEALFEPLLDLCTHDNIAIVHSSLHILHILLKHLSSSRRNLDQRDNVKVEGFHSGANAECNSISSLSLDKIFYNDFGLSGTKPCNWQTLCPKGYWMLGSVLSRPCENWISIYELVNQVCIKHSEERIRLEAISIMNVILMRTNACTERDLFSKVLESC